MVHPPAHDPQAARVRPVMLAVAVGVLVVGSAVASLGRQPGGTGMPTIVIDPTPPVVIGGSRVWMDQHIDAGYGLSISIPAGSTAARPHLDEEVERATAYRWTSADGPVQLLVTLVRRPHAELASTVRALLGPDAEVGVAFDQLYGASAVDFSFSDGSRTWGWAVGRDDVVVLIAASGPQPDAAALSTAVRDSVSWS